MGTSPFEDRPSDEGYQPEAGSPFFPAEHDPDLSSQFVYPPPAQVPRPAPPEPTQGRALRDISKALKDDNDARARVLGSNTLDEMEGKAPDQTAALFDLGASSAMDPTEKLMGSAAGTRAQMGGDEAFEAIKRERARRALEGAKIDREREIVEGGDPMERSIEAEKQAREFEGMLPYGEAPVEKIGVGDQMTDMAPTVDINGQTVSAATAPSAAEARKYAEARGVAEAHGYGGRGRNGMTPTDQLPGGKNDIGQRRVHLTDEALKKLKEIDADQTLDEDTRNKRTEAILRRASIIDDLIQGKGGSGYFTRPLN